MKNQNIRPLVKASAMVLLNWKQSQPSILMIHRNKQISFGNAYAFPGGKCDPQDKTHHNDFKQYAKISAIRQVFEQIGLLLLPCSEQFEKYQGMSHKQLQSAIPLIWSSHLSEIKPILRLMTIQIENGKRFDCIFFTPTENVKIFNFNLFKKTNKKEDIKTLVNIIINEESLHYQWQTPKRYLQLAQKKQLRLFPPQIIMLNAMKAIKNVKMLQAIDNQDAYQPIMMNVSKGFKTLILAGDRSYNYKCIQNEPQSESKNDLIEFIQNVQKHQLSNQRRMQLVSNKIFLKSYKKQGSLLTFLQRKPLL